MHALPEVDRDFNHDILDETAHRPWPMPNRAWLMTQTWRDLLFAHWRVDAARLRKFVPPAFDLDRCDGDAWVGIVPFRMTNVSLRAVPNVPGLSEFPELNVRTYVRVGDRPGVFFFSLDAGSSAAVRAARLAFNLPYFHAAMTVTASDDAVAYRSRRDQGDAEFTATYRPSGERFRAAPGSLEYFLTERYCLYHQHRDGSPYRLDIHHPPWPLQVATAQIVSNTMAAAAGLTISGEPALLHFSRRQDMVAWPPAKLDEV